MSQEINKKKCSKCGKEKPNDNDHFYRIRKDSDKLRNVCIECEKLRKKKDLTKLKDEKERIVGNKDIDIIKNLEYCTFSDIIELGNNDLKDIRFRLLKVIGRCLTYYEGIDDILKGRDSSKGNNEVRESRKKYQEYKKREEAELNRISNQGT